MKKLIFLSLFLILAAVSLGAQTKYFPNDEGTIVRSGYTYKYKMYGGYLSVYNIENRLIDTKRSHRDGSLIANDGPEYEYDGGWSRKRSIAIVQEGMNSLSVSERSLVAGKELGVHIYIDTSTGKVSEVVFRLFYNSPFRYVPVEVYRKIELDLKNEIRFTLTPHGKTLNYTLTSWFQTIKFEAEPTPPKKPVDTSPLLVPVDDSNEPNPAL